MTEDTAAMIRDLHDRQSIHDRLVAYCRGVDRLDRDLLLSAYHADAVDDHGLFVGTPEEFADWAFAYHSKNQTATQHIITNHSCDLDGDAAHTETYWMSAAMNVSGTPLTLRGGRYVDRFERRHGRWAIALRKCLVEWHGQPGELALPEAALKAQNSGGAPRRDRMDPSYDRPLAVDLSRMGLRALG